MTYSEMIKKALKMLNTDGELFVDMVNELDSWDGFADGFRAYPMWELDDLFCDCKVSEFLGKLADGFNLRDEYMVDTIYGLDSTNDIEGLYRDNIDAGELLDNIIEYSNHLYFNNSEFEDLVSDIVNYSDEQGDQETAPDYIAEVIKAVDGVTAPVYVNKEEVLA